MYLVALWTDSVAPSSRGRQRIGVAKVLSTRTGTPLSAASRQIASRSATLTRGLVIVSQTTNPAPTSAPLTASRSVKSTIRVV